MITDELISLRKKISFPIITQQAIMAKFVTLFKETRKREKTFNNELENIFDIMKKKDEWLCQNKELFDVQIGSNGKIDFVTNKSAKKFSIHPSKRL